MSECVGRAEEKQEARDNEGRDKIQQIKSLINTLYKGTTGKDGRGGEGEDRGSGGSGADGDDGVEGKENRDQNSIRLIFSAIKNEFHNLANKNHQAMNVNRERVRANETFVTFNFESTQKPEGNKTDYEEPEVLFDDIILEPLTDNGRNPFLTFLNGSLRLGEGSGEEARRFSNRTLDEDQSNFRNESLKSNFDFLASSLYKYNAAEYFASSVSGGGGNGGGDGGSNLSYYGSGNGSGELLNNTNFTDWDPHGNSTWEPLAPMSGNYWALILVIFPFLTLFGNVLVILAVVRERTLQTATNYFIVSLALADLLVAVLVMPFAVYVLVNGSWSLPAVVCDFYIAMDVTCSTSSIFNLVAISIDRYIAVTQPIKYAKHKNTQRVWSTIALVWVISAAIGSPIVLGLNNTPDRLPDLCLFYNSDFIIYSSLSSFYIPCIIMVFLYYNIFKALRNRARKARATRKPHAGEILPGSVIENVMQTRRLAETALGETVRTGGTISMDDERPTNTGSGSNEDEGAERSPGSDEIKTLSLCADECEVIPNDKSTEFILSTVAEEAAAVVSTTTQSMFNDPNGNNDSGYAASNLEDAHLGHLVSPHHSPPRRTHTMPQFKSMSEGESPVRGQRSSESQPQGKDQKASSIGSRFTIYKVNKASRKKREKSSAKKERKATKTLAIVLGVFLICWVPFFTCNILDALCTKLSQSCQPGVAAFILTTWLGYFNSFVNPVIYTIFNPEFRKAFKKIMSFQN